MNKFNQTNNDNIHFFYINIIKRFNQIIIYYMDRLFGNKKKEEKKVEPTPIKPEEPLIDLTE